MDEIKVAEAPGRPVACDGDRWRGDGGRGYGGRNNLLRC